MSGGDGKDSRGPTGGVKGGPTGLGGGVDASDHSGWSSENNPWGGHDNTGGHTGRGNNGGDHGGGNHSGGVNLSLFPEAQASLTMGAPSTLSLVDGLWGFSLLKSTTVQGVIAEALAKVKPLTAPVAGMLWRGGLWGLVIEAVTPTKIAPDDMSMVRHITTTLPASMVTQTPFSQLPTQPAVVADARVTEVVENGVQKIAVVRTPSIPFGIPTVPAKPTQRPGVYTAAVVEGMPDIHINVGTQSPAAPQKPAEGVQEVRDSQTFQKQPFETGGHTHDAIVYFPPEANADPVYVSVTPVLTEQQVRELQDEFNRRLAQWDARYPADAAERRAYEAGEKLNREQENVNQKQAALDGIKNTPEGLTLADPTAHPITSTEAKFVAVPTYSGGGVHFDATATVENREQLDQLISLGGVGYLNNVLQWGEVTAPNEDGLKVGNAIKTATAEAYDKLRQRLLDRQNEINNAQAALNTAAESRNHAEQEKKDADSNRDKAKEENKGKPTDFTTDDKIKGQMGERGWTEQDIKDVIAKGPKGISSDQRRPKTTQDGLGRDDPATVYGEPGKYVVINDRTREVTQVSDKIKPGWVDDGRIFWGDK
ncbi:hypothetical protein VK95_23235 [Leclercia sp. LK8]|nr:hypothetical protein VK95_23235 [Leclercia sp. LK8]